MRATCAADMSKMGLEVISFTIKEVRDQNEYITNMGRPDIARIRRDAEIASAEAERDTAIRRANALREAAVAKSAADQERVIAEDRLARQAGPGHSATWTSKRRSSWNKAAGRKRRPTRPMNSRPMLCSNRSSPSKSRSSRSRKSSRSRVQEAEILRHEKELIATVLKQSEIERQRVENIAAAERSRLTIEAEGRAAATRTGGEAAAAVIRVQGRGRSVPSSFRRARRRPRP